MQGGRCGVFVACREGCRLGGDMGVQGVYSLDGACRGDARGNVVWMRAAGRDVGCRGGYRLDGGAGGDGGWIRGAAGNVGARGGDVGAQRDCGEDTVRMAGAEEMYGCKGDVRVQVGCWGGAGEPRGCGGRGAPVAVEALSQAGGTVAGGGWVTHLRPLP